MSVLRSAIILMHCCFVKSANFIRDFESPPNIPPAKYQAMSL